MYRATHATPGDNRGNLSIRFGKAWLATRTGQFPNAANRTCRSLPRRDATTSRNAAGAHEHRISAEPIDPSAMLDRTSIVLWNWSFKASTRSAGCSFWNFAFQSA